MKIAWIMHGLSRSIVERPPEPKRGWDERSNLFVNYENSLQNYRDKVFDHADVDTYFHTWEDEYLVKPKIVSDYSPKKYSISTPSVDSSDPDMIKRGTSRQKSIYYSVKNFLDNNITIEEKYDYIVLTRFDLHFDMNVVELLKETDSEIGAGFKTELYSKNDETDDNFFFSTPEKFSFLKKSFVSYVNDPRTRKRNLHLLLPYMKDNHAVDFGFLIDEGQYNVNVDNPLYHIVRYAAPYGTEEWQFTSSPENDKVENCDYCEVMR